jgi:hypothetical protein
MKKKRSFYGIPGLLLVFGLVFCGCPSPTDGTQKSLEQQEQPETPETPDPVDPAFWFGEIRTALIGRIGTVTSGGYAGDMKQMANTQYVCDAINDKWQTSCKPESGTETKVANVEYLLKMIDEANATRGETNYGTSTYATLQALDKEAVDDAVRTLWKPAGKFVAVAYSTAAGYSTDGKNWTAATLPGTTYWNSVAYGNKKFVAVASGNTTTKAAYSTDGGSWTAAKLPGNANWYGVAYGNGTFVAVGAGTTAAYSTDGVNWTAATLPGNTYWSGVAYGNGKFVAVAASGSTTTAAYSTDGENWTEATLTLPRSANWRDVTYGSE